MQRIILFIFILFCLGSQAQAQLKAKLHFGSGFNREICTVVIIYTDSLTKEIVKDTIAKEDMIASEASTGHAKTYFIDINKKDLSGFAINLFINNRKVLSFSFDRLKQDSEILIQLPKEYRGIYDPLKHYPILMINQDEPFSFY